MTWLTILLLPLCLSFPAVYAGQKGFKYREYLKIAVTLSLLLIVMLTPVTASSLAAELKPWFVVSLVFAAVADYLLSTQKRSWFFLAGLCGFFISYSLYGLALHRVAGLQPAAFFSIIPLSIILPISYLRLNKLPRNMKLPVLCYMFMLGHLLLAAFAFFLSAAGQTAGMPPRLLFLSGTGLIFISDSIIAQKEFRGAVPLDELWILSTYYVAQICMVAGLMLIM
ncbi:lysoplasmalogenase family protein [Spirochaeta dissipatitropha]